MSAGEQFTSAPEIDGIMPESELIEARTLGLYTIIRQLDGSGIPVFFGSGEDARRANELAQQGKVTVSSPTEQ